MDLIVAQTEPTSPAIINGLPSPQELMVYQTWAKNAAESQMYRNVGKEAGIMMIMLAAREYGIGPAQALNGGLHIIEGKVELSARMMSALIRKAKHTLKIVESTNERCTISGRRSDTHETHSVTYTIEDAQLAGLIKDKGGWKRTPSDMLYARAVSKLARQLFSDVIGIGYVEGEIIDSSPVSDVSRPIPEQDYMSESNKPTEIDVLLEHFPSSDQALVLDFIQLVRINTNWDMEQTISELLREIDKTKRSFTKFKEKINEKVVHRISPSGDDISSTDA